jgi:uncharacterized RDD family membrane protein YckC
MANSNILTGQYVRINQTAASIGDRILAQLIDWFLLFAYECGAIWLIVSTETDGFWTFFLFVLSPILFYTLLMEVFNHGQSVGKMVLMTRVVKVDGSTPSLGAFLLRWLLFLVDGPMTSCMGLIPIALTRNHQRLGDLAAGTVVIKLQNYKKIQVSLDDYDYLQKNYTPRYPQAADLSLEQVETITRTVANMRPEFAPRVAQLSQKVQEKFGIERAETSDLAFLTRILRDYQYYALEEI